MRIVIDARMYGRFGIGRYNQNLISNLQKIDSKNEYFILHLKKDFESQNYKKNFHKVLVDVPWYTLKEQVEIPKVLKKINPDLVHFPHFNVPVLYRGKYIVTIHDLIHQHFHTTRATTHGPLVYKIKKMGYDAAFKSAIKNSQKIITVSNYVMKSLTDEWRVSKEKIEVTYEGVDRELADLNKKINQEDIKKVLNKFGINPPFILYVGNAHPHKNVEGLVKAFFSVREKFQYLQLVLAGGADEYFWKQIKDEHPNKNIIYTGSVTDVELAALYKSASCYTIPSFEEGFGIPLLEAMEFSCPVVSSNKASLPEVGGNAAVYFNPKNIQDMADKIESVLKDQTLKKDLISKGKLRVKDFSWESLAKQTLEVYENSARS